MLTTLALRHLRVRKLRSAFLLFGFALGVGVMIVLLSVGEAMLNQSRDVALVGGGEVTVLPQGIDVEALRTGGASAMFFGIDQARFIARQVLGGPRHRDLVTSVAPAIEGKLLYMQHGDRTVAVRAGGEIPSRSHILGTGLNLLQGQWKDLPVDSAYVAPSVQQLYDELDRFHLPRHPDSTWAEWHYFNVATAPNEWWYITYLIGGAVPTGQWRGGILITHRRPDGRYERFTTTVPPVEATFDTTRADVAIGQSFVQQRAGLYTVRAQATGATGPAEIALVIRPSPNRYFPPVEISDGDFRSGYVVPALTATATGTICVANRCTEVTSAPAYHDHNWGVWRDVTWEWGAARGQTLSLLYGGIYGPDEANSPFILALVDSLGVRQVLHFNRIDYRGARPIADVPNRTAPESFSLFAQRDADTIHLDVKVDDVHATAGGPATTDRYFLQMRGRFTITGHVVGQVIADSGTGFFETYQRAVVR